MRVPGTVYEHRGEARATGAQHVGIVVVAHVHGLSGLHPRPPQGQLEDGRFRLDASHAGG